MPHTAAHPRSADAIAPAIKSVVVVGGGLAGIAAAVRLAQAGLSVTLVETRKRLGGRATSFVDPVTGQILDNCQHVLMGCCTNLLDLYRRLGVEGRIEWHKKLYFCGADGHIDELDSDDLPAPAHLTRSMMGFKSLTLMEKAAIARGMLAIMQLGTEGRRGLDDISFAQWLAREGQPAGAIEKYWALVAVSAINELPERMAASHAIQVFQEGFLNNENSYVMGLPAVTLVDLYDRAETVLAAAGGKVMLSTSAEGLEFEGGRVKALAIDGGRRLEADVFVSAVPFDRLAKLATPEMVAADPRLGSLGKITVSPIIGIHLWLKPAGEEQVMEIPHVVLMHSPVQWVFNKGWDGCNGGQHLHAVISAAHDWVDKPAEELLDLTMAELRKFLPGAKAATRVHGRVVKEKRATFSATPGLEAIRPGASGAIPNLFLAGDWCRSGWPATMEGATRSGYLAAGAVLGRDMIIPDLPATLLYTLIAGK